MQSEVLSEGTFHKCQCLEKCTLPHPSNAVSNTRPYSHGYDGHMCSLNDDMTVLCGELLLSPEVLR